MAWFAKKQSPIVSSEQPAQKPAYAEGMEEWDSSHWVSSETAERQCAFTHYLEGNAPWRADFAEFIPKEGA